MVISTIPDLIDNIGLIHFVKDECGPEKRPLMVIMARNRDEVEEYYQVGADVVFNKYISVAGDMADYIKTTRKKSYLDKLFKRQKDILGVYKKDVK